MDKDLSTIAGQWLVLVTLSIPLAIVVFFVGWIIGFDQVVVAFKIIIGWATLCLTMFVLCWFAAGLGIKKERNEDRS